LDVNKTANEKNRDCRNYFHRAVTGYRMASTSTKIKIIKNKCTECVERRPEY